MIYTRVIPEIPYELHLLIPARMTMSAEAIIGLIALFIACIPGIRFILRRCTKFRQLWNRVDGAAFRLNDRSQAQGMHIVPILQFPSVFHMGDLPSHNPGHPCLSLNLDSPYGSLLKHNTAASTLQIQAQIVIVNRARSDLEHGCLGSESLINDIFYAPSWNEQ